MSIRNLLEKLPYPITQSLKHVYGFIPLPVRYGKVFRDTYNFLQESQWWSREKLEDYQMQQLEKLLTHAYENVPYYRKKFNEWSIKPKDVKSIDDLQKLPYISKEIANENLSDLTAKNYPQSKLVYGTSGGTTGTPVGFYFEKGITAPKEWAFIWRQWNWAGFRFGNKCVILRGSIIKKVKNGKRLFWEYYPEKNNLILSSYDMTNESMIKYIGRINKFEPVAIRGYPSSLYILANFLRNSNIKTKSIKCILTSSETLYQYQREEIEKYFGAQVYDHYGNAERNALIMQCEKKNYHIISEYGIVELIGKDGKVVNKENEIGEIVATGFLNNAMPFIRYKTNDIAIYSGKECSCGRNYPLVKKIVGRVQDYFVSAQNNLIPLTGGTDGLVLEVSNNIEKAQFYQEKKGVIILKIVKKDGYTNDDSQKVLYALKSRYGSDLNFRIEFVNDIPRTKRGKFQFLIQKLPIEFRGER